MAATDAHKWTSVSYGDDQSLQRIVTPQREYMIRPPGPQPLTSTWYAKQDRALQKSNDMGGMFVWSRDNWKLADQGITAKQYTSCPLSVICGYIYARELRYRNVFEMMRVINPDGTYVPCKVFIDCDLKSAECADYRARGEKFHRMFLIDFREFMAAQVDVDFADPEKTPILPMDSCDQKKWSMHYIVSGIMFTNCYHVGAMIRRFRMYVIEKYGHPDEGADNPYFYVNLVKDAIVDGIKQYFIIDLSIYTPMRAFRLLGNCKYGKPTLLVPYGKSSDSTLKQDYNYPLEEMLRYVVQDPILAQTCKIFSVTEHDGSTPQSMSSSRVAGPNAIRTLRSSRVTSAAIATGRDRASNLEQHLPLPRSIADELCGLVHGMLPQVRLNPCSAKYRPNLMDIIIGQDSGSLYCFTSERAHSSNGNYFVFHLTTGVFKQLCFKSACKGTRHRTNMRVTERTQWKLSAAMKGVMRDFLTRAACSFYAPIHTRQICTLFKDLRAMIPPDYDETVEDAENIESMSDIASLIHGSRPDPV